MTYNTDFPALCQIDTPTRINKPPHAGEREAVYGARVAPIGSAERGLTRSTNSMD
jgi:hypothetical protein